MIAELILETGLSERELLEDVHEDTLAALVRTVNDRRKEQGSTGPGRTARGDALRQQLAGAV